MVNDVFDSSESSSLVFMNVHVFLVFKSGHGFLRY